MLGKWSGCPNSPVEVFVSIRKVIAQRPFTFLADVIHVDARLGHQDAAKHSQLQVQQHSKQGGQFTKPAAEAKVKQNKLLSNISRYILY